jgi:hypothetical protein
MPRTLLADFMRQLEPDPFCSSACCRKWHGCEIAVAGQGDRGAHMAAQELA